MSYITVPVSNKNPPLKDMGPKDYSRSISEHVIRLTQLAERAHCELGQERVIKMTKFERERVENTILLGHIHCI